MQPDTRNLKKRNRIWWFVKQKAGKTIERSLDTEDLESLKLAGTALLKS